MPSARKQCLAMIAVAPLVALSFGVRAALKSTLFNIRVVQVESPTDDAPVDPQRITELAAVPMNHMSLLALDLRGVEKRILKNSWIRDVRLEKRLPQTLSISVRFREPRALIETPSGELRFIDETGNVFGQLDLATNVNFPVFSGFLDRWSEKIPEGVHLMENWQASRLGHDPQIELAGVDWDEDGGFRALAIYSLKDLRVRTAVHFGQEIDSALPERLDEVSSVFQYLSSNSIAAQQIWADAGKKIVVKTAHGS